MTQGRALMLLRNGESCVTQSGADAFCQTFCKNPAPGASSPVYSVR